jgi:hypothetical protein
MSLSEKKVSSEIETFRAPETEPKGHLSAQAEPVIGLSRQAYAPIGPMEFVWNDAHS